MSKRLSILVPDSHTPAHPATRRGIIEAMVLERIKGGGAVVKADNGRVYVVNAHGVAWRELTQ